MPIHRQAEGGPECPGERSLRGVPVAAGAPQAKECLLGDVGGLLVAETESPDKAPDVLAMKGMDLLHDQPRGGSRRITLRSGSFVRHGNHVCRRPTGVKRCTDSGSPAEPTSARPLAFGPVERHAAVPKRHVRVVADYEVVEEVDVEEAAGGERFGRQVKVVR